MKNQPSPAVCSRRTFLRGAQSFAAAGIAAGVTRCTAVRAIEPFVREQPKFKFSLAAYSYRDLLRGQPPALNLFDFASDCAKFGLEGTELTSYYFPSDVTPAYLRELKRHCFQLGLDISGTAVGNDFGHPPGPKRDQEIGAVKRWIEFAEILGAPVIRVFAGKQQPDRSAEETHEFIVSAMETCCEFAGEHGVHLALENHGGPTSTADGLLALVRDVKSPWFGVNLDTGNFHSSSIYEDLERVAPYALNVQVKATVSSANGPKQPADFGRLADMLRTVNYRGYVVLEYEESDDPRTACPQLLDEMREVFC